MSEAVAKLMSLSQGGELFSSGSIEIEDLQLEAANDRFERAVAGIPVLRQRAADAAITRIGSFDDLLPLMLSDNTYKSYPESLAHKRKWKALGAWIDSLSLGSACAEVDTDGAQTIDEWIDRLGDAGQTIFASSGTSGKSSLFWMSQADFDQSQRWYGQMFRWTVGAEPSEGFSFYGLFPSVGHYRGIRSMAKLSKLYGKPGHVHFLPEPMLIESNNQLGIVRRRIAEGIATPEEVEEIEEASSRRQALVAQGLDTMGEALLADRDAPVMVLGNWAVHYAFVQAAKAHGCLPGLHPESVIFCAGGTKGVSLPDDYQAQIKDFYGLPESRYVSFYGMTEVLTHLPRCSALRYHAVPWLVLLVTDRDGSRLVPPEDGLATGRAAILDLSMESRWGGLLTGDRVTVDYNRCPCGLDGPTVLPDIARYSDIPEGDGKTTCAGTMEDYVRGAVRIEQ